MIDTELIEKTITFVKEALKEAEGGHDWFHIRRVYDNAQRIAKGEEVDELVVSLGALLHDIADSKFHRGDETRGPRIAKDFLTSPLKLSHMWSISSKTFRLKIVWSKTIKRSSMLL